MTFITKLSITTGAIEEVFLLLFFILCKRPKTKQNVTIIIDIFQMSLFHDAVCKGYMVKKSTSKQNSNSFFYFLRFFAIEFILEFATSAAKFIPFAIEFVSFAVEFIVLALEFVTFTCKFITVAIN